MDLKKLSLGERIVAGAGLFLLFDLLFLPWHRVDIPFLGTESRSGLQSPNSFLGLLAFLVVAALVTHVIVSEFTQVKLPAIPLSWGQAQLLGAAVVAALLLLKLVMETDFLGFGAWLAIVAAGALVYGGYLRNQESGATSPA